MSEGRRLGFARGAFQARRFVVAGIMGTLGLAAKAGFAHDQWLEPGTSGTSGGTTAAVRLLVGEAPDGEEKVFERAKFSRLVLVSRNGELDLLPRGIEGAKPIVTVPDLGDGEHLFASDRTPVLIELEPAKFEAYLVEEGLSRIVSERAARGETLRRGRERYTRYMKALLQVGDPVTHGMAARVLGQKLELVVETTTAAAMTVRVTFDGAALVGAKLQASVRTQGRTPDAGPDELAATTDALGRATFAVTAAGLVVLHLVHMRRCVEPGGGVCRDADWESFWASFTMTRR